MNIATNDAHPTELERLADEIAELSAHLDAATARLLDLIREFDARGGWGRCRSCADWLSWRVGLDLGAARERVRVARALGTLPLLASALARGELSYSKVRALTRVATPETEARLLTVGRCGTAAHVERIVRGWRRVDRLAEAEQAEQRHRSRTLHVYTDEDGMVVVRGRLEPEAGAVLMKALEAAQDALYPPGRLPPMQVTPAPCRVSAETPDAADPWDWDASAETLSSLLETRTITEDIPSFGQQRADALALLAETALHHGTGPDASAERYQVVVHIDAPVLADLDAAGQSVLENGTHVSAETSRRLACDATRVVMRHDPDGRVTEIGARTRTIPPALRRVLQHRDQGCRFPGCGLPFGQAHHIRHWAEGGPTIMSNLAMLCRRHHRAVHEEGYAVERLPDGELVFRRPNGFIIPDVPPPTTMPSDVVAAITIRTEALGIHIDARTSTPDWLGERLDVGYAIDVLHPLARNERASFVVPARDEWAVDPWLPGDSVSAETS